MKSQNWIRLAVIASIALGAASCGKVATALPPEDFTTGEVNTGTDENTGTVNTGTDNNGGVINEGLTGNKDGVIPEGSTGLRDANGVCYNDTDKDGKCNEEDTDIDGDGIVNVDDNDIDNDGVVNETDTDIDGDGIANVDDNDIDGDGLANENDSDIDGDGETNIADTDIDGDGVANIDDNDVDGDGVTNEVDTDTDGDGVANTVDPDVDGDGILNEHDNDIDGDGIVNNEDTNTNGTDTTIPSSSSVSTGSSASTGGQLVYFNNSNTLNLDVNNVLALGTGSRTFNIKDVRDSAKAKDADTSTITLVDVNIKIDQNSVALLTPYSATTVRMMIYYQLPGSSQKVLMGSTSDASPVNVGSLISGISFAGNQIQTKDGFLTFQSLIRSSNYETATIIIDLEKKAGDLPNGEVTLHYTVEANGKVKL